MNDPGKNMRNQEPMLDASPAVSQRGRWLTLPLKGILDESAQRRVLDIVSFTAAFALTCEFLYLLYADKPVGSAMQAVFWVGLMAFLAVPAVVRLTDSAAPGALIVLVALAGLIVVPAYYQGGASALFTVWFLLVPLLGGLLLGHRVAIAMGILGLAVMTGLFALESVGRLPDSTGAMDPLPAWLNLVLVIAFSALVGAVSGRILVSSADRLQAATLADAAKARALEEAIEGIARVGSDGRFQTVNPAFTSMHASEVHDLVGTPADDWIAEENRKEVAHSVAALAENGRQELMVRGRRSDGSFFFANMFLIAIPNEEQGEHYRLARDVTRQRELTDQLTQSVKMDAIGRLAGGIAHDFNNLLMTILSASDRLKAPIGSLPEPDSAQAYLSWIDTAAQRGAALTRQLLDFSYVPTSDSGPIDVNESLRRLIGMLDSVFGTSIRVETELHSELLVTVGDLARFESGLMNLAVNARDAMPEGGTLRFRTTLCNLDPADPRFAAFQLETDRFVRIEVIDDGAGIASEIIENIFDAFFTTKPVGKGTGLGLSLFYTYTREVGGAMEIESEPGKGTAVSIYLPHSDQLVFATEESVRSEATGDETILLAEDESTVSEFLGVVLSEAGFRVISCADGREVVEKFQKHRDLIDVVLLDYRMPELSGVEAFGVIHQAAPEIPVILMSGNIPGAQIRDLQASGIRDVLSKPCSGGDVLQSVRRAIDTGR
ncbi:MAG: response regulator [Myxococcales bacterium]|nr:response regulator [Myxococcales bacterium]